MYIGPVTVDSSTYNIINILNHIDKLCIQHYCEFSEKLKRNEKNTIINSNNCFFF